MRRILMINIVLLFASCSSYLDVEPERYISSDDVFRSKENFNAALIGCYDALQTEWYYGRTFLIIGDLASDISVANGTKVELKEIDEHVLHSDNIAVVGLWDDAYEAINRVNYLLYFIDAVPGLNDAERNDLIGQLRFLRAFHYFNLVRLFGDLPLHLTPTLSDNEENYKPRTSVDLIYETIVDDLIFASGHITNTSAEYATVLAAKSLLASVFLTMESYQQAYDMANEALALRSYIEPVYANLFGGDKISNEIIFYFPFSSEDKNRLAEYHYPRQLGGRHENAPADSLIDKIDERDSRKAFIAKNNEGVHYCNKYAKLSTGADKVIVLRTTELYFIRSEALLKLDGFLAGNTVLSDINTFRQRAQLNLISASSLDDLYEKLYEEKMLEFAFEGKRWFDLIRTGKAIEKLPSVTAVYQMLFPIPNSEIAANPYISENDQNEGY